MCWRSLSQSYEHRGILDLMSTVISANRLNDGSVTYLDASGSWVSELTKARIFSSKAEEETGLEEARRAVAENFIVEPLVVPIGEAPEGWRALSLRDAIRAAGPTVDYATSTETVRS
jgi:hypothetical protein